MVLKTPVNRKIILTSRPVGAPTAANFELTHEAVPVAEHGQVLLRTVYLSLDPYMRGRMNEAKSYAEAVPIGGVMVGGTVARVEASFHSSYQPGDLVVSANGWQDFALSEGQGLSKLPEHMPRPSLSLGVLGMTGFTAYVGLLDIGRPIPGETVVVAAASGAVGSVVGQIAKLKGCRVVGIAGGAEKCKAVVDDLGFDACIDRREARLPQRLLEACPKGIDIYFENVGGAVFDAVMPLLNENARVPVCGMVSRYNDTALPPGPDRLGLLVGTVLTKRIKMQGFIVGDALNRFHEFAREMGDWFKAGKIKAREDMVEGLENAPTAFIGLLEGKNTGKLIVHVESQHE